MGAKEDLQKLIRDWETKKYRDGEAKGLVASIGEELKRQLGPLFEGHSKDMTSGVADAVQKALQGLKIDAPQMPEIKIPDINMPSFPEFPKIPIPTVNYRPPAINIPPFEMPKDMEIKGWINMMGYDKGLLLNPLPVQIRDAKGNPLDFSKLGGNVSMGGSTGKADYFTIKGIQNSVAAVLTDSSGQGYSGSNPIPVTIASGGSATSGVNVVDSSGIAYSGSNPLPVTITSGGSATSASNIVDSSGVAYSGSNPLPVTLSGENITLDQTTDSIAVRQVSGFADSVWVSDATGSSITSHQDSTGDFRGLDITSLRTINVESALNSSATTLAGNGVFTGLAEDVKDYSVIQVSVFADQVSATDGLSIQQSSNGSNWDITDTYTIPASTGKTFSFQVASRYFRIVYTNGATIQGVFRMSAILHQTVSKNSSQRPGDALSNENDFEQVSAYLAALNPSGNWDRLRNNVGTADGALRVVQAADSISSVYVNNPIDNGDSATALRVVIAGNSISSVSVIGTMGANVVDSSGIAYSGSNPLPVTIISDTINLDQTTDSIAVRQVSGFVNSVFVVGPIAQGDSATALRVIQAGDSVSSVYVNNPVDNGDSATALRVVVAGNSSSSINVTNATLAASIVDSGGTQYSGSNPIPVTLISGALTSVVTVGPSASGVSDDGSGPLQGGGIVRTTNPTKNTDGQVVKASFDAVGRQLVRPVQVRGLVQTAYATLSTGTETTLLAGVASTFLDLIYVSGANNSDAAVIIDIRAATGAGIVMSLTIPANGTAGVSLPVPIPQDIAAAAWTADMPDITGTTVYLTALFSKEV